MKQGHGGGAEIITGTQLGTQGHHRVQANCYIASIMMGLQYYAAAKPYQGMFAGPPVKPAQGLLLFSELAASCCTTTAASTAAAAVAIPFIGHRTRPGVFSSAKADIASISNFTAFSPVEEKVGFLEGLNPLISVFNPKNLLWVFSRSMGLQVLLKFNGYMMQLLEHERLLIEADEQGHQAPSAAPPMPDFKPCFDRGIVSGCRELAVSSVRRVYEMMLVWRVGRAKADALLRDAKIWIRDVLAYKHRLDAPTKRFFKYQSSVLHSFVLFYAAECTVATILLIHKTLRSPRKSVQGKAVTVVRGFSAQFLRCVTQLIVVSLGASLGSMAKPGVGTSLGIIIFDMAAYAGMAPIVDLITGE